MPPKKSSLGRNTRAVATKKRRLRLKNDEQSQEEDFGTCLNKNETLDSASYQEDSFERDKYELGQTKHTNINKYVARIVEQNKSDIFEAVRMRTSRTTGPKSTFWSQKGREYDAACNYQLRSDVQIGTLNNGTSCRHCNAKKWSRESPGMCCSDGKVILPDFGTPPEPLRSLLDSNSKNSTHFLNNIRSYNNSFSMTSFGAEQIREGAYMPTLKVCGQICHRVGSLLPVETGNPQYLQIYFMGDDQQEATARCNSVANTKFDVVLDLQSMLHRENKFIQKFKMAMEHAACDDFKVVIQADKTPRKEDKHRSEASEVGVMIVGQEFHHRDIVLHLRNNKLQRIAETHWAYDALQYPLIHWAGQDGYHFSVWQTNPETKELVEGKKISCNDFYAYRIMIRHGSFNMLIKCRKLFQQYIVDMYAKIEHERLSYIKTHQRELRVADYIHLRDSLNIDGNIENVGQLTILPATFTGGPRYMHERTQDAMVYVRKHGTADLFITFTCNPKWPEIVKELLPNQQPHDRHDIIARVFHLKLGVLTDLLTKGNIFGAVVAYKYTVEWQKRGLPHAHCLVWLEQKLTSSDIDSVISAEIPDPVTDPVLHDIIRNHMIHGPCGTLNSSSPCLRDGQCSKGYPKQFLNATLLDKNGYPLYRRSPTDAGGFETTVTLPGNVKFHADNRWVVPHNKLLCKIFNAHINVEYCNSVKSVQYICKFVGKSSDQAVFTVENNSDDEIKRYETGRYISTNEAIWRILNFHIHAHYPPIVHLSVHLENGQRIYFTESNAADKVANPPATTLTAFFDLCKADFFARTLLYAEVPAYYTWNAQEKIFKRRSQGRSVKGYPCVKKTDVLGRVYTVHPNQFECFWLRLLLHHVRGPQSFDDLKSINGQIMSTFRDACAAHGLLDDDNHWDATLQEASTSKSARNLRHLFAIMLTTCAVSYPTRLWHAHKEALSEDFLLRERNQHAEADITFTDEIFNTALVHIEDMTYKINGKTLTDLGITSPDRSNTHPIITPWTREISYRPQEQASIVQDGIAKLNSEQTHVFRTVVNAVENQQGGLICLDAPGGTGKTFVTKLILAKVRSEGKIAVAVASSGIAATLLPGGRTAHSTFKLPLSLAKDSDPICHIKRESDSAKVLQNCSLIIWDECTMAHKKAFEALDKTLRDLKRRDAIMGGVTLLLSGDFRQTLPIIQRGSPADELNACIKLSYLWKYIKTITLSTNMRVHLNSDPMAGEFASILLQIGDGKIPTTELGKIVITPSIGSIVSSLTELRSKVYPNIAANYIDHEWLTERAILAPKNDMVHFINDQLLDEIPGEEHIFSSLDSTLYDDHAVQYPTEFLNSLELPGMPPHKLKLKVGCPIILLRNLEAPRLCNGTRLCVTCIQPHVIEAVILTGVAKGELTFLPRIPIIPTDSTMQFKRIQFPIKLCFAMTINKSQGQTLAVVGLNLASPCFSHGQFYVGCSRVGSPHSLYILAPERTTSNIVYPRALYK